MTREPVCTGPEWVKSIKAARIRRAALLKIRQETIRLIPIRIQESK
jgi:hypothetical protein